MKTPYIGVCDFTHARQVKRLLPLFPLELPHRLMVGIMMSYKTLNDIPSQWTNIFLPKERIASAFVKDTRVMNCIHYADYTDNDRDLLGTLLRVAECGGEHLDAIQLDMIWPDPRMVAQFRMRHNIPIVLQVGRVAMEEMWNDPINVCMYLESYGDVIDYVLLDRSGGEGKAMDVKLLAKYVGEISWQLPHLGIAVAGGLGPRSLPLVESLIREYPYLSIDAQSKLRPSGDKKDPIHWGYARRYVHGAAQLFNEWQ